MNGFGRLVLLLSSHHDGEVVAARALGGALAKAGRDRHWLAGHVDGEEPAPRQPHEDKEDHQQRAQWLLDKHGQRLREKDRDFLETMLNWPGMPTGRQRTWLDDLCRRYGYRP